MAPSLTSFIRYFTICALSYGALWAFGIYEGVIH